MHIRDSVYETFMQAAIMLDLYDYYIWQTDMIRCRLTGAKIVFKGLDNEENIKGIEGFDIVYNNEWNQFMQVHWKQQRKRLRGRENQKFICDWNPVSSKLWNYEDWIDLETWIDQPLGIPDAPSRYNSLDPEYAFKRINAVGNSVNLKVTYRDNFWVVGHPNGRDGFVDVETIRDFELDKERDSAQYRIYANGERGVLRTGGEFWPQFNIDKHCKAMKYERGPIHVSLDENSVPYVTVAIWQLIAKDIRQIDEIPCKNPNNNAPKAAQQLVNWMQRNEHNDMIYLYGDPSSRKKSTVDPNSASFYDKFFKVLREAGYRVSDRVIKAAPEVALSAAFINELYEFGMDGYNISINIKNKTSIDDYATVKEAPDGTMLKLKVKDPETGQTYEPNGHYSDQKRYFIIELLKEQWLKWKKRKFTLGLQRGHFPGN